MKKFCVILLLCFAFVFGCVQSTCGIEYNIDAIDINDTVINNSAYNSLNVNDIYLENYLLLQSTGNSLMVNVNSPNGSQSYRGFSFLDFKLTQSYTPRIQQFYDLYSQQTNNNLTINNKFRIYTQTVNSSINSNETINNYYYLDFEEDILLLVKYDNYVSGNNYLNGHFYFLYPNENETFAIGYVNDIPLSIKTINNNILVGNKIYFDFLSSLTTFQTQSQMFSWWFETCELTNINISFNGTVKYNNLKYYNDNYILNTNVTLCGNSSSEINRGNYYSFSNTNGVISEFWRGGSRPNSDYLKVSSNDTTFIPNSTALGFGYVDANSFIVPQSETSISYYFQTSLTNSFVAGSNLNEFNVNNLKMQPSGVFDIFAHVYNLFIYILFEMPIISDILKIFYSVINFLITSFNYIISLFGGFGNISFVFLGIFVLGVCLTLLL